jgi:hypothetical protein
MLTTSTILTKLSIIIITCDTKDIGGESVSSDPTDAGVLSTDIEVRAITDLFDKHSKQSQQSQVIIFDLNSELHEENFYSKLRYGNFGDKTLLFCTFHHDEGVKNKHQVKFNIRSIINSISTTTLYCILDCCNVGNLDLNFKYKVLDCCGYWDIICYPVVNCYPGKSIVMITTKQPYTHNEDGSYFTLYIVNIIKYHMSIISNIDLLTLHHFNDYGKHNILIYTNNIKINSLML